MSKPTAVQWLIKELKDLGYYTYNLEKLCEQAKQMEKEQIESAWLNGMRGEMIAPLSMNNYKPEAEEYYHETFGGGE